MDFELLACTKENTQYFSFCGREFMCKCISVYDGDTITVVFKPFESCVFYKFRIRLSGIDTPEMRTKNIGEKEKATEVRDFLRGLILDKLIKIKCGEFDKYGRLLAYVYIDDTNINQLLIDKKFAYEYDGGTKRVRS